MNDRLRRVYVQQLLQEIACLSGATFESFGYTVIEYISPGPWEHRGTSVVGAPVKGTVDSRTTTAARVAQYSSQEDYFNGSLVKLEDDIRGSITKHPQAQALWMVSNREMPATKATDVANLCAKHSAGGRAITVVDARKIAETIADNLAVDRLADRVAPYLPYVARMRDEWALSHRVPKYANYVSRPDVERAIDAVLAHERCVVVSGISGVGKSAAVSAVADRRRPQYDLVVWVDATAIARVSELASIDVLRFGAPQNLLGTLRSRRCLLVLDGVKVALDLDALRAHCGDGSHVIVTTQHRTPGGVVVTDAAATIARAILEAAAGARCQDPDFETVWRRVGGHPLLLSILGGTVRDAGGAWSVATRLCGDATRLEDADHRMVCDRILREHGDRLRQEIEFFGWSGSPTADPEVLAEVCGAASEMALQSRHFLAASSAGVVRLHDLVFESVRHAAAAPSPERERALVQALARYLERGAIEDRPQLQRVARLHHTLLARALAVEPLPAIRYTYALARASGSDEALYGDPVSEARVLQALRAAPDVEIRVRAIIESIEASFALTKRERGIEAARSSLASKLSAYGDLLASAAVPPALRRDVNHHHAKALLWVGREQEAEEAFRAIVDEHSDFAAARVQLGRILGNKGSAAEGEALANVAAIFTTARERAVLVSPSVLLAAFDLLRGRALSGHGRRLIEQHKALLVAAIERAAALGLNQPYRLVGALGSLIGYAAGDLFLEVFSALPERIAAAEDDEDRFGWAQAQKHAAKALNRTKPAEGRLLMIGARSSYESIEQLDDFHRVQYADCLLWLDEAAEASTVLEAVSASRRDEFWHQRMAQAKRARGDLAGARAAIDEALTRLRNEKYRSAFLRDRWLIRRAQGDDLAVEDLDRAVATSDGQFRDELLAERARLDDAS